MNLPLRVSLLCLLSGLTACSSLNPGAEDPTLPDKADAGPPIVSDRFLLPTDGTRIVGELQVIEARYEDTFVDIARAYNLGFDELVQANPDVDPWLPGEGTRVLLPTRFILPDAPSEGIVINLASKRLFFYPPPDEDGVRVVVTYPIGIGREGSATPPGQTTVTQKGRDPVWFVPASIRREYAAQGNPLPARVLPGPDNPLGRHVLVLGMPSYLIHGTNRPAGVGMRVSHGCVRLFPENIEHLYEQVPVGTAVTIVNQPWLAARQDGELYLELHPVLDDDARNWDVADLHARLAAAAAGDTVAAVPEVTVLEAHVAEARGIPLPLLLMTPDANALADKALHVNNLSNALLPDAALAVN